MSSDANLFVPGVMRCAKCSFVLHRVTLHAYSGGVSAGDSKSEPCPNGCGPLWPMTWRQQAEELQERCEEQLARAVLAEGCLAAIEAACAPIVDAAELYSWPTWEPDAYLVDRGSRLTVGELRGVRDALTKCPDKKGAPGGS